MLRKCVTVTTDTTGPAEIPSSPVEDSLLTSPDAKIVAFPPAELLAKPSPFPKASATNCPAEESAADIFRGGGLRGLFWALLLEGAVIIVASCAMVAWHVLHP
jgi:hypothetical protein